VNDCASTAVIVVDVSIIIVVVVVVTHLHSHQQLLIAIKPTFLESLDPLLLHYFHQDTSIPSRPHAKQSS
jgi:hypothetical protein